MLYKKTQNQSYCKISKLFPLLLLLFLIQNSCVTNQNNKADLLEEEILLSSNNKKNEPFYVYGHKNPDLDSYGSAYAYSGLLRRLGFNAQGFSLGKANLETEFVLKFLEAKPLAILKEVPEEAKVVLLDHNETRQSFSKVKASQIAQIIDHHRLDIKTPDTVSVEIQKIGSTATLIYRRFVEKQITPEQKEAGFMLAAILSDTRLLTSPTTTELDKEACLQLAKVTQIDYKKFGKELLLAGTKTDHMSAKELYHSDLKSYQFSNEKASIGTVSTTDIALVLKRRVELETYMKSYQKKEGFSFCVLLITDLLKNDSYALVIGNKERFDKAFSHGKQGEDYFLKSLVSRKRQLVPQLEKAL